VVSDFGYKSFLLNDKCKNVKNLQTRFRVCINFKTLISIIFLLIYVFSIENNLWLVIGYSLAIVNALLDMCLYKLRLMKRYKEEISIFIQGIIVSILTLLATYVIEAKICMIMYISIRIFLVLYNEYYTEIPNKRISVRYYFACVKRQIRYAKESVVNGLTANADLFWVSAYMPALIPIYQPYNRIHSSILGLFPYFAPVLFPHGVIEIKKTINAAILIFSVFLAFGFYEFSPVIVTMFYESLDNLDENIIILMSMLLFIKYLLATSTLIIARLGFQKFRVIMSYLTGFISLALYMFVSNIIFFILGIILLNATILIVQISYIMRKWEYNEKY
jgi:hypothetical protein